MNIGEKAGAIKFMSRVVGPFFSRLFPGAAKRPPRLPGNVMMSFSAEPASGSTNAATPLGLKAIDSLQELNQDKETASNAQIMYLVLLTSGLQILPVTIIAQRAIIAHADRPDGYFYPLHYCHICFCRGRYDFSRNKAKNKTLHPRDHQLDWRGSLPV